MGFWKRNWEKISTDTISGVLIRLIAVGLGLLIFGIVGTKLITLPQDSDITKELIDLVQYIITIIYCIVLFKLSDILQWLREGKQDKIRELELKKEILELENQRENQESIPDKASKKSIED